MTATCPRCGRTHDGAGFCSTTCEQLAGASTETPQHYSARNTDRLFGGQVAVQHKRKVLLDNGPTPTRSH
ncbi:MAG: hypothetical protein F4X59_17215 [Holophagales bacterium]|nr:hypothetical protein [Holophagales bacterium]MYC11847.1 hypothetical protein [Holophagales bacterium]